MLADPESVPALLDAYRAGCEEAGREQGEIVLQGSFSWAPDEDEALENCRVWKCSRPDEFYTDDWHDPQAMYEHAERQVTDEEFKESVVISADPDQHAERIREIERAGRDARRAQQLLRAAGNGGCPAPRRARPPRPSGRSRRLRR